MYTTAPYENLSAPKDFEALLDKDPLLLDADAIPEEAPYPIPEGELTDFQKELITIAARGGHHADWALENLTTDAMLRCPEELEATVNFVKKNLYFDHPTPGKPNRQHAFDTMLLASTMGVTYSLVALDAFTAFVRNRGQMTMEDNGKSHNKLYNIVGPTGVYVVANSLGGKPIVEAYPENSPEDRHMRSVVLLADAASRIAKQASQPGNPYSRYNPVWDLEIALRQGSQDVRHHRSKQPRFADPDLHPLSEGRIIQAGSQFWRNTLMLLLRVAEGMPPPPNTSVIDIQDEVVRSMGALVRAAGNISELQRAFTGVPGEQYDAIRKRTGVKVGLIETEDGPQFKGLAHIPANLSKCSGQDEHEIPIQNGFTPQSISAIGAFVLLAAAVSPKTLFADREQRRFLDDESPIDHMIRLAKDYKGTHSSLSMPSREAAPPHGVVMKVQDYFQDTMADQLRDIESVCSPEIIGIINRIMDEDSTGENHSDSLVLDMDTSQELHRLMRSSVLSGRVGLRVARSIYNHPSLRLAALLGYAEPVDFGDARLDIAFCGSAKPQYLPVPSLYMNKGHEIYRYIPENGEFIHNDARLTLGYYRDPDDAIVQALMMESPTGDDFRPPYRFGDFFVTTDHHVDALYAARDTLQGFVHSQEFGDTAIRNQHYAIQLAKRKNPVGFTYMSDKCTSVPKLVRFKDLPPTLLVLENPGATKRESEALLDHLYNMKDDFQSPRALHDELKRQIPGVSLTPLSGSWGSHTKYDTWYIPSRHATPAVRKIDPSWEFNAHIGVRLANPLG
jgi:hypothetical protein